MTESWKPQRARHLSRPVPRLEDRRLITGEGRFVADLVGSSTLHAAFVRSDAPHGEITTLDTDRAASMPGVVEVVTADSLGLPDIPPGPLIERDVMSRPPLAGHRVRYVGEPIAAVVAETQVQAEDAAERIWPEIDVLDNVAGPDDSTDGPALFPGGNVASETSIQSDATLSDWPIRAAVEVENQRLAPLAIEGLGIICEPKPDALVVTCGHQTPHRLRNQLSSMLGTKVRVIVPDVGGAFGLKGMFFPEYLVVAAVSLRLMKPVAWIESRREHFLSGTHGRGQVNRVELSGDTDGRIHAARIEILCDAGAYPHNAGHLAALTQFMATGLYDIPEVDISAKTVVTNRAPNGSYRGAGRPEAAFAIERAVDAFAVAAALDPVEVRMRNFIPTLPHETASGALYDSGDYAAALNRALEIVDVKTVRQMQQARLDSNRDPIGLGIGAFAERAGGPIDLGEFAEVELLASGDVAVRTGSISSGQGHETVWAQAIAEVFEIDSASVRVIAGDTDEVADGVGTFASRSAQTGASATWRTATSVRERAREIAAEMLEANPTDLRLSNGQFNVAGVPDSGVSLAEVAATAAQQGVSLQASETFVPGAQTFPYGVHIAVVEVELNTGEVRLLRLVVVDDCGYVLNPMIVEGQLHGSATQGIGQALLEGIEYSRDGQPLTTSLLDYRIPAATDVPTLESDRLVHPAPSNPLGVKGIGEAGCIGAPPAILNAVLDALRPYGVTDLEMPLRPGQVWDALQRARSDGQDWR